MQSSTELKSKQPACGSMSSHVMTARTVLRFLCARRGQIGFMYSRLEGLELCSSPPRMRNGLPSTIDWRAPWRVSKCGREPPPAVSVLPGDAMCAAARARQMVRKCVFMAVSLSLVWGFSYSSSGCLWLELRLEEHTPG